MRLSQKADYAIRAMFELTRLGGNERSVRTAELAARDSLPEKFLEGIVVDLRKAGLIKSQRGKGGGHRLAKAPQAITLGDIWRAIDGALSPVASLEMEHVAMHSTATAMLIPVWREVEQAVAQIVDAVTLADLVERADAECHAIDFVI